MNENENTCSMRASESTTATKNTPLTPSTDLYHVDGGWALEVDLPGVGQKDVDLSVEDGVLTVEGKVTIGRDGRRFHQEYNPVLFSRSFPLGDQLNLDKISAAFTNGVLRIDLPMAESVKPRKIDVQSS